MLLLRGDHLISAIIRGLHDAPTLTHLPKTVVVLSYQPQHTYRGAACLASLCLSLFTKKDPCLWRAVASSRPPLPAMPAPLFANKYTESNGTFPTGQPPSFPGLRAPCRARAAIVVWSKALSIAGIRRGNATRRTGFQD